MIFYFSGTGNSLYAAKFIANQIGEELVSISSAEKAGNQFNEYRLKDNEVIGFVHPIYSRGPPTIVLEFIQKLKLINYRGNYVFSIVTCGGSIGNSMKVLKEHLSKNNIQLNSGYSVKMPNNFILMGDVDSEEKEHAKLTAADETLEYINQAIEQRISGEFITHKGIFPWLLTSIINPMFVKKAMDTTKFLAMDHCTHCGTCEKVCNRNNIQVEDKPKWGKQCTMCLACVHYCPVRAIQYGKETVEKGRYSNPHIGIDELVRK